MSESRQSGALATCSHEFSWPRQSATGTYYQACEHCGARFFYDWQELRRKASSEVGEEFAREPNKRPWIPRASRVRTDRPITYRERGESRWHSGRLRNISESGVLLKGKCILPDYSDVEVIFQLPESISGRAGSWVFCKGYVARSQSSGPGRCILGIAIAASRLVSDKMVQDKVPE